MTSLDCARIACLTIALSVIASPVLAQGNGHAYGHAKRAAGPSAAAGPDLHGPTDPAAIHFGSWLDDASMMPAGTGAVTLSFGYWRMPSFSEWDVPVADVGVALSPRVQVGASVPYFHASQTGGPVSRGFGDLYLSAKIQLREPSATRRALGLSVTPVVEVLSTAPAPGTARASWGLPVSAEWQANRWRVFGSTGYFSRGSLFASGALEVGLTARTFVSGTLTQSHSLGGDDVPAAPGSARVRRDVNGALSTAVTDTVTIYAALGRSMSPGDPAGTAVTMSAGAAFSFHAWRVPARRPGK